MYNLIEVISSWTKQKLRSILKYQTSQHYILIYWYIRHHNQSQMKRPIRKTFFVPYIYICNAQPEVHMPWLLFYRILSHCHLFNLHFVYGSRIFFFKNVKHYPCTINNITAIISILNSQHGWFVPISHNNKSNTWYEYYSNLWNLSLVSSFTTCHPIC